MSYDTLLLFIPACFALNMAPGPNNLLSVSNATRHGFWTSCIAGAGRLVAFIGMIAIASAGLATVLQTSQFLFYAIKVVGAAYLFYLAYQLWSAEPSTNEAQTLSEKKSTFALAQQEFLVAAGNPKAILIFTAFLPQFIDISKPATPQFVVLGAIFLTLEWIAIAAYAYMGGHLRRWFSQPKRQRLFNRACGSLLGMAGIGLLAARRSASGV
ncbi:MAG TPA: LysE family translocator [Hydrogenophaga sp.]|nr:LysE family translocator [Hydrogenophaga sp.]